jgi:hypothetical protein
MSDGDIVGRFSGRHSAGYRDFADAREIIGTVNLLLSASIPRGKPDSD